MSDVVSVKFTCQTVVACEVCGRSGDVPWYCKNCPGSLCNACKEQHKKTAISCRHSVVPRTGEVFRLHEVGRIAEQCPKHKTMDITTYCNECHVACCVSCLTENHERHDFSPIEDAYLFAENRLNDYIDQVNGDVKRKLRQVEEESMTLDVEKTKDDVNSFRAEVKNAIDNTCDEIINDLEKSKIVLHECRDNVYAQKQDVDKIIEKCSRKIREGKIDIITYTPPSRASLISKLTIPRSEQIFFIPNRIKLEVMDKLRQSVLKIKKVRKFATKIGVMSVKTTGGNTAWVVDYNSDVMHHYTDSGEIVRSVAVAKGVGINDMAVTSSGSLIVTNSDKKVRCISLLGIVTVLINTAPFEAQGVCLTDKREIMVCMNIAVGMDHVAVYSSDGRNKVREIKFARKRCISAPYRVVQNGNDTYIVNAGGSVLYVDEKGNIKWIYDGTQAKLEQSFNPRGICIAKHNTLLVTDNNNSCVHYIDRTGELLRVFMKRNHIDIDCHWGLSYDQNKDLVWVGNGFKELAIVKFMLE